MKLLAESFQRQELTDEFLKSQELSKTIAKRFWEKVRKTNGCWLWTGSKNRGGYGNINPGFHSTRPKTAHKVSWLIHYGEVPIGLCVCHSCDNPACVKPDHLWLGTVADNMTDKVNKNRQLVGESISGSKLTEKKVMEIREIYALGFFQRDIAAMYQISQSVVSNICNRRTWKHVLTP